MNSETEFRILERLDQLEKVVKILGVGFVEQLKTQISSVDEEVSYNEGNESFELGENRNFNNNRKSFGNEKNEKKDFGVQIENNETQALKEEIRSLKEQLKNQTSTPVIPMASTGAVAGHSNSNEKPSNFRNNNFEIENKTSEINSKFEAQCPVCLEKFHKTRRDKKYCSHSCQQKAKYERDIVSGLRGSKKKK